MTEQDNMQKNLVGDRSVTLQGSKPRSKLKREVTGSSQSWKQWTATGRPTSMNRGKSPSSGGKPAVKRRLTKRVTRPLGTSNDITLAEATTLVSSDGRLTDATDLLKVPSTAIDSVQRWYHQGCPVPLYSAPPQVNSDYFRRQAGLPHRRSTAAGARAATAPLPALGRPLAARPPVGATVTTVDDVCWWIRSLPLAEDYAGLVMENNLTGAVTKTMTDKDWRKIGVTRFGDIKMLDQALHDIRRTEQFLMPVAPTQHSWEDPPAVEHVVGEAAAALGSRHAAAGTPTHHHHHPTTTTSNNHTVVPTPDIYADAPTFAGLQQQQLQLNPSDLLPHNPPHPHLHSPLQQTRAVSTWPSSTNRQDKQHSPHHGHHHHPSHSMHVPTITDNPHGTAGKYPTTTKYYPHPDIGDDMSDLETGSERESPHHRRPLTSNALKQKTYTDAFNYIVNCKSLHELEDIMKSKNVSQTKREFLRVVWFAGGDRNVDYQEYIEQQELHDKALRSRTLEQEKAAADILEKKRLDELKDKENAWKQAAEKQLKEVQAKADENERHRKELDERRKRLDAEQEQRIRELELEREKEHVRELHRQQDREKEREVEKFRVVELSEKIQMERAEKARDREAIKHQEEALRIIKEKELAVLAREKEVEQQRYHEMLSEKEKELTLERDQRRKEHERFMTAARKERDEMARQVQVFKGIEIENRQLKKIMDRKHSPLSAMMDETMTTTPMLDTSSKLTNLTSTSTPTRTAIPTPLAAIYASMNASNKLLAGGAPLTPAAVGISPPMVSAPPPLSSPPSQPNHTTKQPLAPMTVHVASLNSPLHQMEGGGREGGATNGIANIKALNLNTNIMDSLFLQTPSALNYGGGGAGSGRSNVSGDGSEGTCAYGAYGPTDKWSELNPLTADRRKDSLKDMLKDILSETLLDMRRPKGRRESGARGSVKSEEPEEQEESETGQDQQSEIGTSPSKSHISSTARSADVDDEEEDDADKDEEEEEDKTEQSGQDDAEEDDKDEKDEDEDENEEEAEEEKTEEEDKEEDEDGEGEEDKDDEQEEQDPDEKDTNDNEENDHENEDEEEEEDAEASEKEEDNKEKEEQEEEDEDAEDKDDNEEAEGVVKPKKDEKKDSDDEDEEEEN